MKAVKTKSVRSWLKSVMFKRIHGMISCVEFESFIQAYTDGELDSKTKRVFELHIRFCRECREYLAAYQRTIEVGSSLLQDTPSKIPRDVPEELIRAVLLARNKR